MKKEKKKPTTVLLNKSTPMALEKMARNEGLNRTTGIPSGETVGSISQLLIHIARDDVVIVKRHKVAEILPPDGIEVLTGGKYTIGGWQLVLMTFSSANGWLERDRDGDWITTHTPLYWVSLGNFWEGVE